MIRFDETAFAITSHNVLIGEGRCRTVPPVPKCLSDFYGGAEMSNGHWHQCRSVLVPKCLGSKVSIHPTKLFLQKLHHPRSDAYSAIRVLLNKQQIWCGGAYLHHYQYVQNCVVNATKLQY